MLPLKPTKPEYADSFGEEVMCDGTSKFLKIKFWHVVGLVNEIWSRKDGLHHRIRELLDHNQSHLSPPKSLESAKSPSFVLTCYMIGLSKSFASPHAAIICQNDHVRKAARRIVLKHGILEAVGWGQAFLCLKANVTQHSDLQVNFPTRSGGISSGHFLMSELITESYSKFRISCSKSERVWSPVGAAITVTATGRHRQRATMGGVVKMNDTIYGMTAAHAFREEAPYEPPQSFTLEYDPDELDIYGPERGEEVEEEEMSETEGRRQEPEKEQRPESETAPNMEFRGEGAKPIHSGVAEKLPQQSSVRDSAASNEQISQSLPTTAATGTESGAIGQHIGRLKFLSAEHIEDEGKSPNLDYALFSLDSMPSWQSNSLTYRTADGSTSMIVPSSVTEAMPRSGSPILFATGPRGHVFGTSIEGISVLKLGYSTTILVWAASLSSIQTGECGSWAFSLPAGEFLGMLVAACPALNEAYIIPATNLLASLKSLERIDSVTLPQSKLTDFRIAITAGNQQVVDSLLSDGINPSEEFTFTNFTDLYQAAKSGDLEAAKNLVAEGADVYNGLQTASVTAVAQAIHSCQPEILKALIAAGAGCTKGETYVTKRPIHAAIKGGYADIVEMLVAAGASLDSTGFALTSPALFICLAKPTADQNEMMKLLLEGGADANEVHELKKQSAEEVEQLYPNEKIRTILATARQAAEEKAAEEKAAEEKASKEEGAEEEAVTDWR